MNGKTEYSTSDNVLVNDHGKFRTAVIVNISKSIIHPGRTDYLVKYKVLFWHTKTWVNQHSVLGLIATSE